MNNPRQGNYFRQFCLPRASYPSEQSRAGPHEVARGTTSPSPAVVPPFYRSSGKRGHPFPYSLNRRPAMTKREMDELMSVGEQLTTLIAADVPLAVGLGTDSRHAATTVERTNAAIARHVSRGDSLYQAVEQCNVAPANYRYFLLAWLRGSNLTGLLDCSHHLAQRANQQCYGLRASLYYPLLVCILAYLGTIGFCIYLVPALVAIYETNTPGPWLRLLQGIRDTLPYWAPLPPLLLVFLVAGNWLARRRNRAVTHALVSSSPGAIQQHAALADLLSQLLAVGTPRDEALQLAVGTCGNARLLSTIRELRSSSPQSEFPSQAISAQLPPLLAWTLFAPEAAAWRPALLHTVADLYRDHAQARAQRNLNLLALFLFVVLGGGVTLAYALMLMLPVVEMLRSISS